MLRALRRYVRDRLSAPREIEVLYKVLYDRVHDLDEAQEIIPAGTAEAFRRQWSDMKTGEYLLSDPWFKENVARILCEEEVLLAPSWFAGKRVLDAGCGNGRWSFGLAQLGAIVTCADINEVALEETRSALAGLGVEPRLVHSSLESLHDHVKPGEFDLVFCWGVAHHCVSFNRTLDEITAAVAPDGVLYLYLYGRETMPISDDLRLFRERVAYSVLMDDAERTAFLMRKAHGDKNRLHNVHDIYAPLINRRFTFDEITSALHTRGFTDVKRTIDHSELFIRATRGVDLTAYELPPKAPPYWFEEHSR